MCRFELGLLRGKAGQCRWTVFPLLLMLRLQGGREEAVRLLLSLRVDDNTDQYGEGRRWEELYMSDFIWKQSQEN